MSHHGRPFTHLPTEIVAAQIVPPVRTLHNSASVSSVSAFGTCSPSFTSSIEVCPVAALPVELVSVDTKSNHKLPHVIVLPPSEDVPALLPTETLGNPPVSTAVIPPRFPKLDDGVCIISMSASLQDFSSSGDQGTCFVNPFNDRPPLPDIPVATPEPSDTVAAKPSHLGELRIGSADLFSDRIGTGSEWLVSSRRYRKLHRRFQRRTMLQRSAICLLYWWNEMPP